MALVGLKYLFMACVLSQLPRLLPSFCCMLCPIFYTLYSKLQIACQAVILNLTNKIVDYLSHLLPDWSLLRSYNDKRPAIYGMCDESWGRAWK